MRKVGFIGAYDKTDLILYVAKMLTIMEKKVLVIDTTTAQKAKYIVPVVNPTISYVTNFEQIDIAVGFNTIEAISDYLGKQTLEYDYVMIDVDSTQAMQTFEMETAQKKYFVSSFDTYCIRRGLEILGNIKTPMDLTKTIFTKEILKEEDDYLNFLSVGYKVKWSQTIIYFPLEMGDGAAVIENQRLSIIRFKNLTNQYRDSLIYIIQELIDGVSELAIRKALKTIERGA